MKIPRICIVGAGRLASARIYPYIASAGGELAGVCDLDEAKRAHNTRLFGGRPYADVTTMINTEKPDGVIVCIGPEQHAQIATQVMRMGYPVYTEKPPAADATAALAVARVAKETGLLCTTAFKKRHTLAATRAKEWLAKFPVEDVHSISIDYASGPYANTTPRNTFLLDFGIHAIDLLHFLLGDVAEVFAFAKGPNAYAVSCRAATGGLGVMNLNDGRSFNVPTEEIEITVKGGNFMTIHNSSSWRITEGQKPCEWREPPTFISAGDSGRDTGHFAEIEDFLKALVEGRTTTRSSIYESYKSLVFHDAIQASATSGSVVRPVFEPL